MPRPYWPYAMKVPTSTSAVASKVNPAWRQVKPSILAYSPVKPGSVSGLPDSSATSVARERPSRALALPNKAPMVGPNTSAYKSDPVSTKNTVTGR